MQSLQTFVIRIGRSHLGCLHDFIAADEYGIRKPVLIPLLKQSQIDTDLVGSKPIVHGDKFHKLIEVFDVIHNEKFDK